MKNPAVVGVLCTDQQGHNLGCKEKKSFFGLALTKWHQGLSLMAQLLYKSIQFLTLNVST